MLSAITSHVHVSLQNTALMIRIQSVLKNVYILLRRQKHESSSASVKYLVRHTFIFGCSSRAGNILTFAISTLIKFSTKVMKCWAMIEPKPILTVQSSMHPDLRLQSSGSSLNQSLIEVFYILPFFGQNMVHYVIS